MEVEPKIGYGDKNTARININNWINLQLKLCFEVKGAIRFLDLIKYFYI